MASSDTKSPESLVTLHHLNDSQSQRILWLLEELETPYNLCLYSRDEKTKRAPPELKAIHPLGKSPLLELPDKRVISESSAIIAYLLRTGDPARRFAAHDLVQDEVLTSFAGATLGPVNGIETLFDIAEKHTPWPLKLIARTVRGGIQKVFTGAELENGLRYLEDELGEKTWFNGDELGRCDVMLSWPLDIQAQRGWVDFPARFPKLAVWRARILEREAWKRGIEKGNTYDLMSW
ncbi:hypothetical protein BJ878DRAFT_516455 [Calycina marina]|uniref:Glutathione S-transferase n=1 Tax=Calycina marina TaxID=1763456 RepID=A0A9P8CD14_9HELO|nr:hypothetical protein BJ878DRAFT_516455 [Calycina marina]